MYDVTVKRERRSERTGSSTGRAAAPAAAPAAKPAAAAGAGSVRLRQAQQGRYSELESLSATLLEGEQHHGS